MRRSPPSPAFSRPSRRHDYPLDLSTASHRHRAREAVQERDGATQRRDDSPGYAFRMDVWRLWIRRQHSVWQVIRELGLAIPHGKTARGRRWLLVGLAGTLAAVVGLWINPRAAPTTILAPAGRDRDVQRRRDARAGGDPRLDGQRIGIGSFRGPVTIGSDHRVEAPGKGIRRQRAHRPSHRRRSRRSSPHAAPFARRPPCRDLPAGADVSVDGRRVGKSPAIVRSLRVAESHRVPATLAGFGVAEGNSAIDPGAV